MTLMGVNSREGNALPNKMQDHFASSSSSSLGEEYKMLQLARLKIIHPSVLLTVIKIPVTNEIHIPYSFHLDT
jgi:hypothetical protein